jgi:hypothetical protein
MDEENMPAIYEPLTWCCGQRGVILDDFEICKLRVECFECMRIQHSESHPRILPLTGWFEEEAPVDEICSFG